MTAGAALGVAGVVLAGGRSSRMGTSKAELEWHGTTLLQRTASVLIRTVTGPVVVVRAPGQELPPLPSGVVVVEDDVAGQGPVQGIASGLAAVATLAEAAFVCSTDLPFLHPAFVRRVAGELGPAVDIVLPVARGYAQPLAAAYRTALHVRAAELVAAGRLRPVMLSEEARVLRLDDGQLLADADLAAADPELDSLLNVNRPDEYATARSRPAPMVTVVARGSARRSRLASVGAAAAFAGVDLAAAVLTLNGSRVVPAPALPLVTGDVVEFSAP